MSEWFNKGDYDLELSAWGGGTVDEKEIKLSSELKEFRAENKREPEDISLEITDTKALGLDYYYTSIDTGLLLKLTTLKELILPPTIENIDVTPELEKHLKKNDVLIRGDFDSFAEKFAAELGLHFRPASVNIGGCYFEPAFERTTLTLTFARDGSVQIEESVSSPGSSAGNTFGGTFYHDLPNDFYLTMTAESVAEQFGTGLKYHSILERGKLAEMIEKMKTHNVYMGKN